MRRKQRGSGSPIKPIGIALALGVGAFILTRPTQEALKKDFVRYMQMKQM